VFVSGSTATVVGTLPFNGTQLAYGFWRRAGRVIVPDHTGNIVRIYNLSDDGSASRRRQRAPSQFARADQAAEKLAAPEGTYDGRGFVFATETGDWLNLNTVSKSFSAILRDIGIKVKGLSLHSLRHFVGTTALATGIDVRTVSDLLGHVDPGVTLRVYSHAVAGAKERAVTNIGDVLARAKARRLAGQN
jgi:integrase